MKQQSKSHMYSFAPTLADHQKRQSRKEGTWGPSSYSPSYTQHPTTGNPFYANDFHRLHHCELRNPIHPMFCPVNFPGQDYDLLKPVLRLATRLLTSQPLLPFWHALFFGNSFDLPELSEQYDAEIGYYSRTQHVLSRKATIMTYEALEDLAEIVRFYPRFPRAGHVEIETECELCAYCKPRQATRNRLWYMPARYELPGVGSVIHINPKMLEDLRDCRAGLAVHGCKYDVDVDKTKRDSGNGIMLSLEEEWAFMLSPEEVYEPASAQAMLFQWAVILVHEVAHAAHRAALSPSAPYEYFFEDGVVAEAGHDWEAWAFGGRVVVNRLSTTLDGRLTSAKFVLLLPWPWRLGMREWVQEAPCRVERPENFAEAGDEIAWRVGQEFIAKLFTDDFWDNEILERGREALWPEKELGGWYTELERGFYRGANGRVEERNVLPEGYEDCIVDSKGLIRRLPRSIDPEGFGRLLKMPLLDDL